MELTLILWNSVGLNGDLMGFNGILLVIYSNGVSRIITHQPEIRWALAHLATLPRSPVKMHNKINGNFRILNWRYLP